MASVVRAAAYVPVWGERDRRVPGPDEDPFTIAATAAERAVEGLLPWDGPLPIELIGDGLSGASTGFGPLLGLDAEVTVHAAGPAEFGAAIRRAAEATSSALIVAVDTGSGAPGPARGRSAGAVAFLFRAGGAGPGIAPLPEPADDLAGPLEIAQRWYSSCPAAERSSWVGDWGPDVRPPRPAPARTGQFPTPPSDSVSEGAYLPLPRYREGLPSRWGFVAERCNACGSVGFPARGRCRGCGTTTGLQAVRLPKDGGTVIATTWIGRGGQPTEFDPEVESTGSYGVALVEIAPGLRATLQLTDCTPGEIRLGDRVGTRLRRIYSLEGEWRYARKAVPRAPAPDPPGEGPTPRR